MPVPYLTIPKPTGEREQLRLADSFSDSISSVLPVLRSFVAGGRQKVSLALATRQLEHLKELCRWSRLTFVSMQTAMLVWQVEDYLLEAQKFLSAAEEARTMIVPGTWGLTDAELDTAGSYLSAFLHRGEVVARQLAEGRDSGLAMLHERFSHRLSPVKTRPVEAAGADSPPVAFVLFARAMDFGKHRAAMNLLEIHRESGPIPESTADHLEFASQLRKWMLPLITIAADIAGDRSLLSAHAAEFVEAFARWNEKAYQPLKKAALQFRLHGTGIPAEAQAVLDTVFEETAAIYQLTERYAAVYIPACGDALQAPVGPLLESRAAPVPVTASPLPEDAKNFLPSEELTREVLRAGAVRDPQEREAWRIHARETGRRAPCDIELTMRLGDQISGLFANFATGASSPLSAPVQGPAEIPLSADGRFTDTVCDHLSYRLSLDHYDRGSVLELLHAEMRNWLASRRGRGFWELFEVTPSSGILLKYPGERPVERLRDLPESAWKEN